MKNSEVKRFAILYKRHQKLLKLQGKSKVEQPLMLIPVQFVGSVAILIAALTG